MEENVTSAPVLISKSAPFLEEILPIKPTVAPQVLDDEIEGQTKTLKKAGQLLGLCLLRDSAEDDYEDPYTGTRTPDMSEIDLDLAQDLRMQMSPIEPKETLPVKPKCRESSLQQLEVKSTPQFQWPDQFPLQFPYSCLPQMEFPYRKFFSDGAGTEDSKLEKMARLVCFICKKFYKSKYTLKVHMMIHTGEMAHKCRECGASFRHYAQKMTHQRKAHPTMDILKDAHRGRRLAPPKFLEPWATPTGSQLETTWVDHEQVNHVTSPSGSSLVQHSLPTQTNNLDPTNSACVMSCHGSCDKSQEVIRDEVGQSKHQGLHSATSFLPPLQGGFPFQSTSIGGFYNTNFFHF